LFSDPTGSGTTANPVAAEGVPSYELGVAFDVTEPVNLTGMRFWKASGETGGHVGTLWAGGGEAAQASFSSESDSGWQVASFSPAVQLEPGTTYVLSVNVNAFFVAAPFASAQNGPLETAAGPNGLFASPAGSFPDQTFSRNYFVDPIVDFPTPATAAAPAKPVYHQPPGRAGYCDPKTGQFYDLVKGQDQQAPYSDLGLVPAHVDPATGAIDCNFPPVTASVTSTQPAAAESPFSPDIQVEVLRSSSPRPGTSTHRTWLELRGSLGADRFQFAQVQSQPWRWHAMLDAFTIRTGASSIWIRFGSGDRTSSWQLVTLAG
jgi:hypothetical protein